MPMTPRTVAFGLLLFSFLALLVGIFNTARLNQESARVSSDTSNVSRLLNRKSHLALIELSGPITMEHDTSGPFISESPAVLTREALDEAAEDESVKGVLLRINTPGGTVAMSQELNAAVRRVTAKKPVVVSMGDLTASGGYYTACAADKIFANPGTLTGSIGVIISTMDISQLLHDKLSVQPITVKSGKFKDLLSPYRPPGSEELALIQKLVDESYQDFLNTVLEGRTRVLTDEAAKTKRKATITAVADGRILHGHEAVKTGLADEIGDLDQAYTALDMMAKERFHIRAKDRLPLETYNGGMTLLQMLGLTPKATVKLSPSLDLGSQASQLLPFSLRHPNQPLWIME